MRRAAPKCEEAPCQRGTYSFTTPIYYVNAAPHLGTAYTTIRRRHRGALPSA